MVLVAAVANDFSSGEIRFYERYFFRHPHLPLTTAATADHYIPTDVLFSLYIYLPSRHFISSSYSLTIVHTRVRYSCVCLVPPSIGRGLHTHLCETEDERESNCRTLATSTIIIFSYYLQKLISHILSARVVILRDKEFGYKDNICITLNLQHIL